MNGERSGGGPGGGDGSGLVAERRVDAEVARRRREHWIRRRLAEEATLSGALAAARGRDIAVQLTTGDRLSGVLAEVGSDVAELRRRHATDWVALHAVAAVETPRALTGDTPAVDGASLLEVLVDLAADRRDVTLLLVGGTTVRGELLSAGELATVRTGPDGRTALVPVGAIACVGVAT